MQRVRCANTMRAPHARATSHTRSFDYIVNRLFRARTKARLIQATRTARATHRERCMRLLGDVSGEQQSSAKKAHPPPPLSVAVSKMKILRGDVIISGRCYRTVNTRRYAISSNGLINFRQRVFLRVSHVFLSSPSIPPIFLREYHPDIS